VYAQQFSLLQMKFNFLGGVDSSMQIIGLDEVIGKGAIIK
jgi:hypothetical protein